MASSKQYLEFILEQLSNLKDISYRAMMGEYIIYYQGKIVGGIYDDRFLVKPTKSAITMMPNATMELPYKGAKEMLLVDEVDNKEFLKELFNAMYSELPASKVDEYLIEPDHPSILHGDLWSGNFMVGPDGDARLIDPAAYFGCAEADIAMTELFGGFSGAFYGAYKESGLIKPGYEDRRDIYNLYHVLNHLNLFGGSYLYAVERIANRF